MAKKQNITLEIDSALSLMQEIYNDIVEQKNIASTITRKMLTFMKEPEDMSMIGPVIKEQQKILNDCTEKKISLVKLQGVLLKQTTANGKTGSFSKITLSDEDKKILEELMNGNEDEMKKLINTENYKS